jgi:tetratricopeptide (TPR) repeat protein
MSLNRDDIELIEKYIDNDLSGEESISFQNRMKDEDFFEELRLQESTAMSIKRLQDLQLKEELRRHLAAQRDLENDGNTVRFSNKRYMYWAAAAIAIVIVSFFVLKQKNEPVGSLYLSYYKPYPMAGNTRGETNPAIHQAFEKYTAGDYREAAVLLQQLLAEKPSTYDHALLELLLGNCYLNLDESQKALASFKKARYGPDQLLKQHAQWYYMLALLKQEKLQEVRVVLKQIVQTRTIYHQQASTLLEQLEQHR